MIEPLLQTKLFIPPLQPNLVPRPRLIEQLDQAVNQNCRLILVSAAAGFGKSTILNEWVHSLDMVEGNSASFSWVSLDSSDNDQVRFLAYFIGALQGLEEGLGKGALGLLQSPEPPVTEMILTALINEITEALSGDPEERPFVLILDDYHRIDAQSVHETLIFLLDHLPPRMHLVIASRTDPPLALPRLRVRGELVELREADLRFNFEETAALFERALGLPLQAEDITALDARTEGWIAGLQVAVLSMKGLEDVSSFVRTFTGSHRYVMDYLVDEVLNRQPEAIQNFLLDTAVLDQMTGRLCEAVTGQPGGQETLERLDKDNLFIIPLDDERRWYRYHHLFTDLLRSRLDQTAPDRAPDLYRRASEWYELNGFIEEATKHALAAAEYDRAAMLIEKLGEDLWERGEPTSLLGWLEALPDEYVVARPGLCNFHAWTLHMNGQNQEADSRLQAAERVLHSSGDPSHVSAQAERARETELEIRDQLGRAAAIRASMASRRGDIPAIIHFSNLALDYLPESSLMWRTITTIALGFAQDLSGDQVAANQTFSEAVRLSQISGNIYLIMSTSLHLGNILSLQGQLKEMNELCQDLMRVAAKRGVLHTEMAGCLYDELGLISSEWNELEQAMVYLSKGSELSRQGYDIGVLGYSYLTTMRALYALGDSSGAQEIIQEMELMEQESDVPSWFTSPKEAWKARFHLLDGDIDAASRWAVERGLKATDDPTYMCEEEYLTLAKILIAQGRTRETLGLLEKMRNLAEEGGRNGTVMPVLLLEALAYRSQGDTDQAMMALERALSLAEPAGAIRVFLDEGEPMADLMRAFSRWPGRGESASRPAASREFLNALLDGFSTEQYGAVTSETKDLIAKDGDLIEPLSDRELEVLRLLATGLSYREIAEELYVSINTIKAHAKNIYSKLGVHGRVQAMHRATELNLLYINPILEAPP
ncbi:MAG: LuxR C-terminal-related transcriptional regulator [Candidatus Promineifilaceae bacterium]